MLAMWVPEMPFQMACQQDPGLKDRPLAFLSPGPQRTPCLWLVNRLARAEGLAPGEPMDHALRRLPGLRVLDPAPQTWWEAQASLGEFLQHWSPQGLLGRMGEALVDLDGTGRLFGAPQDTAARIQRELAQATGWTSHGGLSRSATAARLATRLEFRAAIGLEQVPDGRRAGLPGPPAPGPPAGPGAPPALALPAPGAAPLRRPAAGAPAHPGPAHARGPGPAVLTRARGEDRPRLPMLADPRGNPAIPGVWSPLACPRRCPWPSGAWSVSGTTAAPPAGSPCAGGTWTARPTAGRPPRTPWRSRPWPWPGWWRPAFRQGAQRRILVHRLELHLAWGLGRARGLFETPLTRKLGALEPALARLRKRFPEQPVLPGWARRGEGSG